MINDQTPSSANNQLHAAHLFVPATQTRLATKAASSGASAVIIDLEDAVASEAKASARENVAVMTRTIRESSSAVVFLRPNNEPELLAADLLCGVEAEVDGFVYPKAGFPEEVAALDAELARLETVRGLTRGHFELELLIESACALRLLPELVRASSRVTAIAFGVEDFATDLGIDPDDPLADLSWAHGQIILGAGVADVPAYGILDKFSDFRDLDHYSEVAKRSRAFGYSGSYCIHPAQVSPLVKTFLPSEEALSVAKKIAGVYKEAASKGQGATSFNGRMIDKPIFDRAMATLERGDKYKKLT